MKKKIIIILCAVLMLATVAVPAFAAEFEVHEQKNVSEKTQTKADTKGRYENLMYEISDGEVTITGYVTEPVGALVIPEKIEGYPVTTIGTKAFDYCYSLTSVEMPNVQTIGDGAFRGCNSLTSVEMPKVQTIGGSAFYSCDSLESVEMPQVQTIGEWAFYDCYSLTSVEMPQVQMIGDYAFYWCESLTSVEMPNVQTIGESAFTGCSFLTSIIISPDNENFSAEGGILYNKDKSTLVAYPAAVDDIKIADSVQMIGEWAFYWCESLTSVEMPSVHTVGEGAFLSCTSLTSVEMPKVQTIGERAFSYCDFLTSVEMLNVHTIGSQAFEYCESLTSAYFYSDAPTSFGEGVFEGCADDFTIYYAKGTKGWTTPTWNGYPTKEFDPNNTSTHGDLTGEGVVNTADAVSLLKLAAGMIELTPEQESVADVNRDGTINTADAVTILKYAAGLIDEL